MFKAQNSNLYYTLHKGVVIFMKLTFFHGFDIKQFLHFIFDINKVDFDHARNLRVQLMKTPTHKNDLFYEHEHVLLYMSISILVIVIRNWNLY